MSQWKKMSFRIFILVLVFLIAACAVPRSQKRSPAPKGQDASYYYLLSEMEIRHKNFTEALSYIGEAIEKDPSSPRFWYKRALVASYLGDFGQAEEDVRHALQLEPTDRDANILLGKICQSQDRLSEAIPLYRKALEKDPLSEEANVLLLETYIANNQTRTALSLVFKWQREDTENILPIFYEAWIYQNFFKNQSRAIAAYQRVVDLDPSNAKALAALAEIYLERKEEAQALEVLQQLETLSPEDANLKLKVALIYYEQKQYDKALEKFENILRQHPEEDRIVYYMGVVYENLKRDDVAENQFRKIQSDSSFYTDARLHLSFLKNRQEDVEGAIAVMEEAIKKKTDSIPLYEYLAEIHRDRKNYEEAIAVLEKGLKKNKREETLWYSLGMVYDKAGLFDDMVRSMRQVLKINPKNTSALNYLGYSYADRGLNLDEALDLLQKAAVLKPKDGFILDSLGWVHFQRGEWEQAKVYIEKAYKIVPEEPTITEHLGDIYRKENKASRSLKYYREAESLLEKKTREKDKDEDVAKSLERVRRKIAEMTS